MSNYTSVPLGGDLFARSGVEPVDPTEVPLFVSEYIMGQNFQVAMVTVLVYDTLITLDKEVRFFWKIPKKAVDYVFFLNRYVGIFGAVAYIFNDTFRVDLALCNFAGWTRNIANWVTITSIDYILTIRVLALYSQDRRLSIFLMALLGLSALVKLGFVIYLGILKHIAVGGLAKNATACGVDNFPPWQLGMVDWLIPLTYGAILMALALWKAAEFWKISAGFRGFGLVKILILDQVWYFMLVTACSVFSILNFRILVSNGFLSEILTQLGNPAFLTILGSRLLFNMKEAGERGLNEGTSCNFPSGLISDIASSESVKPPRRCQTDVEGGAVEA